MLNGNDLELVSAYLDGALSESERAALEARLQTDAELRRELARLRATVDLIKTLPTLPSPRPLTLTSRMVRRPNILTSAAFSALSTAAAVILLVIGAALFTSRPYAAPAGFAARNVAAVPTASSINEPDIDGENNPVVPPLVDNFQATMAKSTTEIAQESSGVLNLPEPTTTPQSTLAAPSIMLYAASLTEAASADGLQSDTGLAQAQLQPGQDAAADQQRTQAEQAQESVPAPASVMGGAAAAQAPLPAPTLGLPTATVKPTQTATSAPSSTPSATDTSAPTLMPSPSASAVPTLAPTLARLETPVSETGTIGVGLIAAALLLFGLAIVTTILRRRS